MTPANNLMAEAEARKMRGACHKCGELGHRSSECDKPKVVKGICHKCKEQRHRAQDCLTIFCPKWKGEGHTVDKCTGPETRFCRTATKLVISKYSAPGQDTEPSTSPCPMRPAKTTLVQRLQLTTMSMSRTQLRSCARARSVMESLENGRRDARTGRYPSAYRQYQP